MTEYQVGWYVRSRIIRAVIIGEMTVATVDESGQAIVSFLDDGSPPVHVLLDLTRMTSAPPPPRDALDDPIANSYFKHPNLGWSIYCGDKGNPFYQFVTSYLAQTFGVKVRWFNTLSEGYGFLKEVDDSLT